MAHRSGGLRSKFYGSFFGVLVRLSWYHGGFGKAVCRGGRLREKWRGKVLWDFLTGSSLKDSRTFCHASLRCERLTHWPLAHIP